MDSSDGSSLPLVLPSRDRAVGVDDADGDLQAAIGHALRAQDDRDAGGPGGIRHISPRPLEERRIRGRRCGARPAIAGNEALGKADHRGALSACVGDRRCRQEDGLLRGRRHADVRERDANLAHVPILSHRSSPTGLCSWHSATTVRCPGRRCRVWHPAVEARLRKRRVLGDRFRCGSTTDTAGGRMK